jgi:hypothetical protein
LIHADRSIPIPWLAFKHALQQEFAAAAAAEVTTANTSTSTPTTGSSNGAADPQQQQRQQQQQQLFGELLHLIELLSRSQYSADARYLQAALLAAQPQLSEQERQLLGDSLGSLGDQGVQVGDSTAIESIINKA